MSAATGARKVGFIGLGRLGSALASLLVETKTLQVVCCARGRSDELVAKGAVIAGDGSVRAVAEEADVICTNLPSEDALENVVSGTDGLAGAGSPAPVVIELSTFSIGFKERMRDELVTLGGDMLDCPVGGTPPVVSARKAMIYASGQREVFDRVADVLTAMSPGCVYAGDFGTGTKLKYVAASLAMTHVAVAAEAMSLADAMGLDRRLVAEVISASPGATSGQFNSRAPRMVSEEFEGDVATIAMGCKDLQAVAEAARLVGAPLPYTDLTRELFDDLVKGGDGQSDPAKLFAAFRDKRTR